MKKTSMNRERQNEYRMRFKKMRYLRKQMPAEVKTIETDYEEQNWLNWVTQILVINTLN